MEPISNRPLKEKRSITLDADVIEELKILAEQDSRIFSGYVNLVLRNHIEAVKAAAQKNPSENRRLF